ncbi:cytochrome-c peroxidase [Hyphomicrobium sp.]|uniref:cytochrome-c peroxidase n=1 Tax=Hyphomicrobium sp. TaxID=82 RepID=UPI002E3757CA|nr:cytochrome c peroxidase [Hyphomicrobium sp.]HEX2841261.1 cytochrome c peroxidase [Hyphomicrobium sp.]
MKSQVELGRKLFFDRRLAFNNTNSCAMCHIESQGLTTNQSATAIGMEGRSLSRNAPALYNVAYQTSLFHDGRESDLAQQAWAPLLSPLEMANPSIGHVVDKIRALEDYAGLFEAAFGGHQASMQTIGDALASYQRTLLSGNSRFDRWYYGKQQDALSPEEKHGFEVFMGKGSCATCHTVGEKSALFTDDNFYVTGIGYYNAIGAGPRVSKVELAPGEFIEMKHEDMKSFSAPRINDIGRFALTLDPKDRWAYKTPGLRNVELTYPYMHDGSLSTLEDVVAFYDKGGIEHDGERVLKPLGLTDKEKADLVAFLKSLTTPEDQAKHAGYR